MTVDEIYEIVAANMYRNIEVANWTQAVLEIKGDDTAMGINGYYIVNGINYPLHVYDFDAEVEFALMELHEIMTEGGNNEWNNAIFSLFPDGKFNIEFSLEDEERSEE